MSRVAGVLTHSRVSDLECCRSSRKYFRLDCTSSSCSQTLASVDCSSEACARLHSRRARGKDGVMIFMLAPDSLHLVLDGLEAGLHIELPSQVLPDAPVPKTTANDIKPPCAQ
jgi:hypothetical protein